MVITSAFRQETAASVATSVSKTIFLYVNLFRMSSVLFYHNYSA